MLENINIATAAGWCVGIGVFFLGVCGVLIRDIWSRHVSEADKNKSDADSNIEAVRTESKSGIETLRTENDRSHREIHERIDNHLSRGRS